MRLRCKSFDLKAEFLVELDRARVIFPNRVRPDEPEGLGRVERLPDQAPAYPLPPEFRQSAMPRTPTWA